MLLGPAPGAAEQKQASTGHTWDRTGGMLASAIRAAAGFPDPARGGAGRWSAGRSRVSDYAYSSVCYS